VRMRTREEKWRRKGSHSSSMSGLNCLVWLQTWKKWWACAPLSEKCCCFVRKPLWKSHQIWTSTSEEKHFGCLSNLWFGAFVMLFSATGCVVRHENTRRWTVGRYNGLYVTGFGDFEKFVLAYIACPRYPYI